MFISITWVRRLSPRALSPHVLRPAVSNYHVGVEGSLKRQQGYIKSEAVGQPVARYHRGENRREARQQSVCFKY